MKLVSGIANKILVAELVVYNKNSEKTCKVKRLLQLILPLHIVLLEKPTE